MKMNPELINLKPELIKLCGDIIFCLDIEILTGIYIITYELSSCFYL